MGLFNFLKHGITIEEKKTPTTEVDTDDVDDAAETEAATEETNFTPNTITAVSPEPATMSAPQPSVEEKRMEAASVLLGDNGLSGGSTPSLIQMTQAPAAQQPKVTPVVETPQPTQPQIFNTHNNTGNFDNALLGQVSANQNLLVIAPQTPAEISTILTNLANGNACIVSLSKFALPDAQRFLDYICGFVNAIGGMIMQKTSSEYILAPKGVNIKNS